MKKWISLLKRQPTEHLNGPQVILYRITDKGSDISIHKTDDVARDFKPLETWWLPIPEPPELHIAEKIRASISRQQGYADESEEEEDKEIYRHAINVLRKLLDE